MSDEPTTSLTWKRCKESGAWRGFAGGRAVARIRRVSASCWPWSYRSPSSPTATLGEARRLNLAKGEVQTLHDATGIGRSP